ncbi:MAG: adenylyltransferase [Thermoprotei archaeon]|nr:MAG: adenylyltransferase [Thermoprotei archaeon]
MLSANEKERFSRQIALFGEEAQVKLKKSTVAVIGVGGLGSFAALYLAAAGVGRLTLVDKEKVELSNLNRQILYWTRDIGEIKVEKAAEKIKEFYPEVEVEPVVAEVNEENAREVVKKADVIVDGLDNWKTRLIVNKVCVKENKPFVHAGVKGLSGQLLVVIPRETPCLQCILPPRIREEERPPIVATTVGLIAALEVQEALKIITGFGEVLKNKMLLFNGYTNTFTVAEVYRRKDCTICGES